MSIPMTGIRALALAACLAAVLSLTGACSAVAPAAAPETQGTADTAGVSTSQEDAASADVAGTVTPISFSTQESTFLSHIQDAAQGMAEPDARIYAEVVTEDGTTWQGERLVFDTGDVVFLQPAESDGASAVRLDVATGADSEAIMALLPNVDTSAGNEPDVDVQFVRARLVDSAGNAGVWSFDVTVAHPDTGWEDYVDGWHVETPEGAILGTRILLHPHVNEQPFTRSLGNVTVPGGTDEIRIRPHDLVSGYGSGIIVPLAEAASGEMYEVVR